MAAILCRSSTRRHQQVYRQTDHVTDCEAGPVLLLWRMFQHCEGEVGGA
eukprot:CAMPEP_0114488948 /NCGR_PEP_ID=MMETSP0109-20121206/1615_1 /TAXON_ID=29199 /ORGANISM="Chlorarachnion reptans, Strain CCCM449" /LENGTH=48 /DNA_ID= /DNA_START= /DNA_END= /DNA_ORIENTATION=